MPHQEKTVPCGSSRRAVALGGLLCVFWLLAVVYRTGAGSIGIGLLLVLALAALSWPLPVLIGQRRNRAATPDGWAQPQQVDAQRWLLAIDGSGQGAWDWDLVRQRAWYSPGWYRMLGYEPGELDGSEREWRLLIHPDDLAGVLAEQSRHYRGDVDELRCQYRMRKRSGDYIWLLTRGRTSGSDRLGRPVRITGTNIDISRLKAAEQALENRERVQRTLMDALPLGLFQTDRSGRVVFVNRVMETYFGVGEADIVGRNIYELSPPNGVQLESSRRMDEQVMASGASMISIESHLSADGTHHFEVGRIPHRNAQGEVVGLHGYIRDISAQYNAEQALRASEQLYRSLSDALPMGLFRIGSDRRLIHANRYMLRHMGAEDASKVIGRDMFHELIPSTGANNGLEQHLRVIEQGLTWTAIEPHVDPRTGKIGYLEITRTPVYDESGKITGEQGVFRDATEQVLAERQLSLTSLVFESGHHAVVISDENHVILRVNRGFTRLTGYAPEDVIGKSHAMMGGMRHDEGFYSDFHRAMEGCGHWEGETVAVCKDGRECEVYITTDAVRGDDGRVTHHVAIYLDISERKATEEKIRRLAQHDQLTDLPNRTLLRDRVERAIETGRRTGRQFALLFLDLDRFKTVNDSLGHEFGDKLLREAALRLSSKVRAADTVSRHGGDEFVIMLAEAGTEQDVRHIAGKLIDTIAEPFVIDGREVNLSLSVGVAMYPGDGTDIESLLRNADMALYATKQAGRNHYRFYSAEMDTASAQRLQTENELRRAVERAELYLDYQPQLELGSMRVVGAEALVRWRHPARGLVSPGEFIPIAEESGLIIEIGRWVMETACRQYASWLAAGLPVGSISVNVSGHQFRNQGFVASVFDVLERSGLPPDHLELEVTETVIMQGSEQVLAKLNQLAKIGVRLAIDDFGTGYSSLSYLKLFPLDRLKVDQAFVRGLPGDSSDAAIVRTVIGLGHNLDLNVLAEGIETEAQLGFLQAAGCHVGQGYHFSRPLGVDAFEAFVRRVPGSGLARTRS